MTRQRKSQRFLGLLAILLISAPPSYAEHFTLVVEPLYPPDQAQEIYSPLVNYLKETTGHDFNLETPRDFQQYWLNLRRGDIADLVLSEGTISSLLLQRHEFQLVGRANANAQYVLLAGGHMADAEKNDFVGHYIATMPSPSLGYLILADYFDNPMAQPEFLSTPASWMDSVQMVFSAEADAAIAPKAIADRYPNLIPTYESEEFPGLTLTASPAVSEEVVIALRDALLTMHEDPDNESTMIDLDIQQFIVGNAADYRSHYQMLGAVFGYSQN